MDTQQWKVTFYTLHSGDMPVMLFIDSLDEKAQGKIINTMHLLKNYGINIGLPHAKKITGTDMWELRILGSDSLRIFYLAVRNKTFLLLHGFKKKTQKTPTKELKIALSRLAEYRARA